MRVHAATLILLAAAAGCDAPRVDATAASPVAASPPPARLTYRLVATYPHDPRAFTQGLLWHGGRLFESTGVLGHSTLREVELASGKVLRSVSLSPNEFGEGLALAGDRLVQLTWQNGRAHVWDRDSFSHLAEHAFDGEGWGLTFDGKELIQSDGSSQLAFRSPATFSVTRRLAVTREGRPQFYLNELDFAAGAIWANVWISDEIVRIDPTTGEVTGVLDVQNLLTPAEAANADVLNGIAWDTEKNLLYATGKDWPKLFALEVR